MCGETLALAVSTGVDQYPGVQQALGGSSGIVIAIVGFRGHGPAHRARLQHGWRHEVGEQGMFPHLRVLVVVVLGGQSTESHHQRGGITRLALSPVLQDILVQAQGRDIVLDPGDPVADQVHVHVVQGPAFGDRHQALAA